MTDATETGVSAEAEAQAQKQNAAAATAEAESGAVTSTDIPAPGKVELSVEPPKEPETKPEFMGESKRDMIARKRTEQMSKDHDSLPEIPAEVLGLPADPEPEPEPEPAPQGGMVTIKVNGEEQQVPAEQVLEKGIRTLQKEVAADKRLEQASKRMSELDAREQRIAQREQELAAARLESGGEPAPSASADVPTSQNDIDYNEIVDDLYAGNKEKAAEALKAIAERGNTATQAEKIVDPNEIATIVETRQAARKTLSRFYGRYPTIKADPNLQTIVNNESRRVRDENPDYTNEQILMETGRIVTERYGGKVVDDTGFTAKADRKAQTDTVTGADVVRTSQPEQQPKSRKAVVEEMRAGRR